MLSSFLNKRRSPDLPVYKYNLQQTKVISEQRETDRVFSVFLRYGGDESYQTTLEFDYMSGGNQVTENITDTTTKHIYWNSDGTLDMDKINEENPFEEEHREYGGEADTGVYMWYYDDIGNGWYRFYMRTIGTATNTSFTAKILNKTDLDTHPVICLNSMD